MVVKIELATYALIVLIFVSFFLIYHFYLINYIKKKENELTKNLIEIISKYEWEGKRKNDRT